LLEVVSGLENAVQSGPDEVVGRKWVELSAGECDEGLRASGQTRSNTLGRGVEDCVGDVPTFDSADLLSSWTNKYF